MSTFLRNLAILAVIGIGFFVIFPETMQQVLGIYNGLGMLPVIIVLVVLAALPRKSRRRGR